MYVFAGDQKTNKDADEVRFHLKMITVLGTSVLVSVSLSNSMGQIFGGY